MTDALYNRIEAIEMLRRRRRPRIEEPADFAALARSKRCRWRKTTTAARACSR